LFDDESCFALLANLPDSAYIFKKVKNPKSREMSLLSGSRNSLEVNSFFDEHCFSTLSRAKITQNVIVASNELTFVKCHFLECK
jgi:hypothetical protein